MERLFLKLFNMSISAGWLILAVLLLRLVLKKAPRWTVCLLWAIVGVRLVCPFSLESALSLIPSAQTLSPRTVQYAAQPEITSGVPFLDNSLNPVLQHAFPANDAASATPLYLWTSLCSILWVAGVLVMLAYALVSCLRLRRQVVEAAPLRGNIWQCDGVRSPFILGVVRPRIYLPSGMEEEQMACVLAHEQAHLDRRDHWWKALGYLLLAVYWFHPLVWAAYVLLCRDIGLACDEKVIRELNLEGKKTYSRALLFCSAPRRLTVSCPLAFGEVGVKERIQRVLRYHKPAVWTAALAGVACIVVAVCFLTDPKQPEAPAPDPRPEQLDRLDQPDYSQMGHTPQVQAPPEPPSGPDYSGYDELIALAEQALADREAVDDSAWARLSSVFHGHWDYETLGWTRMDLDGDGVDELLFGANGDVWDGVIYDLYTLSDGAVVRVLDGWERNRYYLCENGRIANEWSNSAFEWGYCFYSYQDGQLTLEETLEAHISNDNKRAWFYAAGEEDPQTISEDQVQALLDQYQYVVLQFTPFENA